MSLSLLNAALPTRLAAQPPTPGFFGTRSVPADIIKLLAQTRDAYGTDAVALQALLLHHTIHSQSILSAGVQVTEITTHLGKRYLLFAVDTGIVFNDNNVAPEGRIQHLWSQIALPALTRSESNDLPGDGVAVALRYFHRPYKDAAELEDTVVEDPGTIERATFYLLFRDLLAYRARDIDATELFARSGSRTDTPSDAMTPSPR